MNKICPFMSTVIFNKVYEQRCQYPYILEEVECRNDCALFNTEKEKCKFVLGRKDK